MNLQQIKNYNVPLPVVLVTITLVLYLPFLVHVLGLREIQIKNGEDINTVLPIYGTDSIGYVALSDNLIERHIFSVSDKAPFVVDTFRTPGYPGMLAIFKYIFGSYKFFPLVQIFFTILTAIFILKIGTKVFSERIGMVASVLYVIDPNTIWHTLTILSEVPFALFLISALYYLFFSDLKNQYLANILGGLFLGIATLIRPISMFMPIFMLPIYLYINKNSRPSLSVIKNAVLILAVFLVVLMPWMFRNKQVSGVWGISSVKDFNFFHYTIPEYISFKRGVAPDDIRKILYDELRIQGVEPRDATSLSNVDVLNGISYPYLKGDLFSYGKWHIFKMTPFFLSSGIKNFFYIYNDILHYTVYKTNNSNLTNFLLRADFAEFIKVLKGQILITLEQIFWAIILVAMFIPIFDKKKMSKVVLLLALIFYLALPTVPVGYSRFRIPAAPYMFILATAGLFMAKDFLKHKLERIK